MSRLLRKNKFGIAARACESLESRQLFSIRYVDANPAILSHDGAAWTSAYADLQQALAAASAGDQIRVADGTYKPTSTSDQNIAFQLKTGVAINGGYAGFGAPNPDDRNIVNNLTVLSGDLGTPGTVADNSYRVLTATGVTATAVLDGFTITAASGINRIGGGIYLDTGSPTISNCIFTANTASSGGAVGTNNNLSAAKFANCTFTANSSFQGGAVFLGGATATFTDCTFSDNAASQSGGAYYGNFAGTSSFTRCTFVRNTASSGSGGAVYCETSQVNFTACTLAGNSATTGSALYLTSPATFNNSILVGNTASNLGGVVFATTTQVTFTGCTLVANSASQGGVMASSLSSTPSWTLTNCIVWGNTATIAYPVWYGSAAVPITYTDYQGGFSGTGNVSVDPLFVRSAAPGIDGKWGTIDDDYGDLRISSLSPVVDAGNNSAVPSGTTTDITGGARFLDVPTSSHTGSGTKPLVDMGAYETTAVLAASAGGPYVKLSSSTYTTMTLRARGASNVAGTLTYAWDFNNDGVFTDATGANPSFNVTTYAVGAVILIAVRVTDSGGHSIVATTQFRVVPGTFYVDSRAAGDGTGRDWNNAFITLSGALAAYAYDTSTGAGPKIFIATGTYVPTATNDRTISFKLPRGLAITGGYAGLGAPNPDARDVLAYPTVLSGDIGVIGNTSDNSYHVITSPDSATLTGVTISGGNASGTGSYQSGGGVYNTGTLTISSCTFTSNSALSGGALHGDVVSSNTVGSSTFMSNAASAGGAIYIPGPVGSVNATIAVSGCMFVKNSASSGGAVYCPSLVQSSSPFTQCTFSGNTAASGGAAYLGTISKSSVGPTIPTCLRCIFTGNSASNQGGAIFGAESLESCIISGNSALNGGGIYASTSNEQLIYNCTIVANRATSQGGGIYFATVVSTLANSIVYFNTAPTNAQLFTSASSNRDVRNSDVQGGISFTFTGANNIASDPLFLRAPGPGGDGTWGTADDDFGDLHLSAASPCVDAGDSEALTSSSDLDSNTRTIDVPGIHDPGAITDIGALERQLPLAQNTAINSSYFLTGAPWPFLQFRFTSMPDLATVSTSDLQLLNLTTGQSVDATAVTGVSNDPANSMTLTWTFRALLDDGKYLATLPANALATTDGQGNTPLTVTFYSLAGDANGDHNVNTADFTLLAQFFNKNNFGFTRGDFNFDNKINALDFNILASRFGTSLPSALVLLVAGLTSSSTPTAALPEGSRPDLFADTAIRPDADELI